MILRDFWERKPLELERYLNDHQLKEGRPHRRSKMFFPPISTQLWVLIYSWPAEVVSVPLDVAPFQANSQLLKGPRIANVTREPELLITPAVHATTSELFRISGTNYHAELSAPAIKETIAVDILRDFLRYEINECRAQIARGRGSSAPYAIIITGPTPDRLKFEWLNLDYQQKGCFADLVRVFGFLLSISTTQKTPGPNPWYASAFSYVFYWEIYGSQPEKVGRGIVGL